jgi:protein-disulfide isomerase-like protein with CxxC motif
MASDGLNAKHYDKVMDTVEEIRDRPRVEKVRMYDGDVSKGYPTVVVHCNGWIRDFKIHIKMGEVTVLSLRKSPKAGAKFRLKFRVY